MANDPEIGRLKEALRPRTCEGCAHWKRREFKGRPLNEGECQRITMLSYGVGAVIESGDANERAALETHPTFGCTLWLDRLIPVGKACRGA